MWGGLFIKSLQCTYSSGGEQHAQLQMVRGDRCNACIRLYRQETVAFVYVTRLRDSLGVVTTRPSFFRLWQVPGATD